MGNHRGKTGLRNRLLLSTLIPIIIGMSALGSISYLKSKASLEKVMTDQVLLQAASTVAFITQTLQDRKLTLGAWAEEKMFRQAVQNTFLGRAVRETVIDRLSELKKDYPIFEDLHLADIGGMVIASSNPDLIGKTNIGDQLFFQEAGRGNPFTSDVIPSGTTGNPVFMISSPVKEADAASGVIFGVMDLGYFTERFINPVRFGESGYAFLFRKDGTLIAHPDQSMILKENIQSFDFGPAMMNTEKGVVHYVWKGEPKSAFLQKMEETGWTLAISVLRDDLLAPALEMRRLGLILTTTIVGLAILSILWVVRSTVRPIHRVAHGLEAGAEQIFSASNHIASVGQFLARGASDQASAIEEMTSALEEMASMTRHNADNAAEVNHLMQQNREVVEQANHSMKHLHGSMTEISASSRQTSKIVKTIDEIAFQTNLLALNAAVEAARAGSAGAGFAVVAEEVRNLSRRTAEAARDTTGLIEDILKKIMEGESLVSTTDEAFRQAAESARKAGGLVHEIAEASEEQARGIAQVNESMADVNKITQENAAGSEEAASSSEEIHAQAEQLNAFVEDLILLVDGGRKSAARHSAADEKPEQHRVAREPVPLKIVQGRKGHSTVALKEVPRLRAANIIPCDAEDLRRF